MFLCFCVYGVGINRAQFLTGTVRKWWDILLCSWIRWERFPHAASVSAGPTFHDATAPTMRHVSIIGSAEGPETASLQFRGSHPSQIPSCIHHPCVSMLLPDWIHVHPNDPSAGTKLRLSPTIPPIQLPPNVLFTIFYYLPKKYSSPITPSLQPFPPYLFPLYTITH